MKTMVAPFAVLRAAAGFTLIELMVTIAILAALLTIGANFFKDAVMNARMIGQANDLMADLNVARSEAVRRNLNAYLCASTNGTTCGGTNWSTGWIVYVDINSDGTQNSATEPALKSRDALTGGNTLTAKIGTTDVSQIVFHSSGASSVGGGNVVFTMCDSRTTAAVGLALAENKGRLVTVSPTGRPVVTKTTC